VPTFERIPVSRACKMNLQRTRRFSVLTSFRKTTNAIIYQMHEDSRLIRILERCLRALHSLRFWSSIGGSAPKIEKDRELALRVVLALRLVWSIYDWYAFNRTLNCTIKLHSELPSLRGNVRAADKRIAYSGRKSRQLFIVASRDAISAIATGKGGGGRAGWGDFVRYFNGR